VDRENRRPAVRYLAEATYGGRPNIAFNRMRVRAAVLRRPLARAGELNREALCGKRRSIAGCFVVLSVPRGLRWRSVAKTVVAGADRGHVSSAGERRRPRAG
jgi:hypothetical protein